MVCGGGVSVQQGGKESSRLFCRGGLQRLGLRGLVRVGRLRRLGGVRGARGSFVWDYSAVVVIVAVGVVALAPAVAGRTSFCFPEEN
jgi:hypothetical protein